MRSVDGGQAEDRRVWYLILQISFPEYTRDRNSKRRARIPFSDNNAAARHLRIINSECRPLGVTIRNLNLSINRGRDEFEHYLFRFQRYARDDSAASRFAEALAFGFSVPGGALVDPSDPMVLRIPDSLVRDKHVIPLEKLTAFEESRAWNERSIAFPRNAHIAGGIRTITKLHDMAWRIAAITFKDAALFDATRFLHRSYENFSVAPGGIDEVIYDPDSSAKTGAVQNDFEDALHSAFKAVEAIIGDPPKDDRRFFAKLAQIGLDPTEEAGYVEKIPFERMIRRMNEARDKRSAHGSTRHRRISAAELLDFQTCAQIIVLTALEKARGRPLDA